LLDRNDQRLQGKQGKKKAMRSHQNTRWAAEPSSTPVNPNPYREATSTTRLDAAIRDEIRSKLDDDPLLNAVGSVDTDEAKRRAETLSRQISGISGHDCNLALRRPAWALTSRKR
jgi:hypothetical protein